tara:strand:+ start:435 stop:2075 length:1641 start_codon:yes stop_codon:yes gene_type:complete
MPVVFSPGEAETRPLNPEEIVYTTAQKVADLLGIGPQEAVLMSANAEANAVFVTGADFRNIGFSVGDIILIYSDADPMGVEQTITAITSTTSGVKLAFSSAINPGLYETTDNGFVQNTASFTNGKTRGVKKSHVEQRIKEIQDRIDNITHNAWRPTLVSAEYINFDTYKPYRRRYYVDYVGSTPLLYRNVQQMLRIELWQGDDYREICSAEARVEIADYTALNGKRIVVSPGGGGFGQLVVGTGTTNWDDRFDKVSTAQSLADLINKEDRTNRSAIPLTETQVGGTKEHDIDGAAFTLPVANGTQSVNVNNEFLATANSDYGNGKLKITSMRQTKGGESATIATDATTGISISQTTTATSTMTYAQAGAIWTVASGDTNSFVDYGVALATADGYTDILFGYTSKTGTQLIDVHWMNTEPSQGINYTVTQHQFKSDVGAFSDAGGDQARLKDWWIDHEVGMIYFNNSYPFFEHNAVKVSYIYGERYLEKAIEEAATKMVAVDLLMADDRSVLIPEGSQNVPLAQKIQMFKEEANSLLNRYKEMVLFE